MLTLLFTPGLFSGKMAEMMEGLAALLRAGLPGLSVFSWPVESVSVPAAVVGYPTTIEYDTAYDRGGERLVFPLWYMVAKSSTPDARDHLSLVISSSGDVKDCLDGAQAFGDVRVTGAEVSEISVAGVAYLAAKFDCEVYG